MRNQSIISDSMILLKKNKLNKVKTYLHSSFCWICTLIIWGLIGVLIYIYIPEKVTIENFHKIEELFNIKQQLKLITVTAIIIFYCIYIILEILSPILIYLKQDDEEDLINLMKTIFSTKPSFFFKYDLDKSKNEKFEYSYWRDISGLFKMNITDEELKNKKYYIMLKIKYYIIFADKETEKKYDSQKEDFIKKITQFNGNIKFIREVKKIKNVKKYYKVKTNKKDCCFIDFCYYIIFTILTFSELYKLYINSKIIYEKFIIIKTVSTNTDLKNSEIYESYNPQLRYGGQFFNYKLSFTNSLNNNLCYIIDNLDINSANSELRNSRIETND